jgi:sensor histidine kinase YesM
MVLSLSAIAVVLIVSGIISIVEYRRMSNYVSDMIAEDINSINVAQKLSAVTDAYNLQILTVIGDDSVNSLPDFDQQGFVSYCDSLRSIFSVENVLPLTDSVLYSYQAYMLTSLELEQVIQSDFIDSRTWYFERLQPSFQRLNGDIDRLSQAMYADLQENSEDFDRGFYRSIIPGIVAVAVGVILVLLLMFFITSFYVKPLNKMLEGLDEYRSMGRRYNYSFDGDDELVELNEGITELTEENRQYRRRIKLLKETQSRTEESE